MKAALPYNNVPAVGFQNVKQWLPTYEGGTVIWTSLQNEGRNNARYVAAGFVLHVLLWLGATGISCVAIGNAARAEGGPDYNLGYDLLIAYVAFVVLCLLSVVVHAWAYNHDDTHYWHYSFFSFLLNLLCSILFTIGLVLMTYTFSISEKCMVQGTADEIKNYYQSDDCDMSSSPSSPPPPTTAPASPPSPPALPFAGCGTKVCTGGAIGNLPVDNLWLTLITVSVVCSTLAIFLVQRNLMKMGQLKMPNSNGAS